MVAFTDRGEKLVGHVAKRQAVTNPSRTVFAAKRLIGRRQDTEEVRRFAQISPFGIEASPKGNAWIRVGDRLCSPEEISAVVLAKMRETAADFAGANVFDTWSEAMAGTAPAGSEVWAAAGPQEWQERIPVMADPVTGQWLADFPAIGFDITEEMWPWSYAHIYDEDGDANEGSTPPAARLVVQITDNWFRAEQFAPNAELTYWVYDARDGNLILGPETAWTDDYGTVTTDVGADLVQGNFLVVTDGSTTKEIILEPFRFDIADLSSGLLTGTALPSGRAVWLGIGWQNQDIQTLYVTSNENGGWTADFGVPASADYWWIAAQIFDPDGDASELRPEHDHSITNDCMCAKDIHDGEERSSPSLCANQRWIYITKSIPVLYLPQLILEGRA